MKTPILIAALAALAGCKADTTAPMPEKPPSADNTKANERDRGQTTLTPVDQGENELDRTITQQVRQGVVAEDGLSITAKNVKIITVDAIVTLRGPVNNAEERARVVALAQRVAGVKRVDNQLEIAPN
jgi:hyperosmotically inducible protein